MIINHNLPALNTYNRLNENNQATAKSLEKLSSGLRINRAGDDAAGLAISEKMRGQIRGLDMAQKNSQDAISLIQTAEGALTETHSILQRMREVAVQASNDTNTDADRVQLQAEITASIAEIDQIGNTTEFNTKKLIDGSAVGVSAKVKGSMTVSNNSSLTQVATSAATNAAVSNSSLVDGAYLVVRIAAAKANTFTAADYQVIGPDGLVSTSLTVKASSIIVGTTAVSSATAHTIGFTAATAGSAFVKMGVGESVTIAFGKTQAATSTLANSIMAQVGANSGQTAFISMNDMRAKALGVNRVDVSTKFGAQTAIATIDVATAKVSTQRANMGAIQNRLEHITNNLSSASENITAAESRIRDVDMAKEMMSFQKNNILNQAATAMLAQANQQPQGVLQLLR